MLKLVNDSHKFTQVFHTNLLLLQSTRKCDNESTLLQNEQMLSTSILIFFN